MRKLYGALSAAAVVAGLVVAMPAAPALANSPGLPFSADALPTWQTNGVVWDLAASHGKVVAVGTFTQISPGAGQSGSPQNRVGVAIFNAATGQPDSCQLPAALSGGTAQVFAAQTAPDGETVFIGGNFTSIGGVPVTRLAEIDVETCTVTPFRVNGISSTVRDIAVTDNAVYFGGLFVSVAGQERRAFAKVNRAGVLQPWIANATGNTPDNYDPAVDPNAVSRGESIVVSPDETKVALGGGFFWVNGTATHSIAVVDATTGSLLRAYPNFVQNTSRTQSLVSDGVNFYAGNEGSAAFDGTFAVNWDTLNQVWRDTCLGAVQALLVHDGLLFHAHHNHDCASMGMFPDGRRIYLTVTHAQDPTQRQIGWLPELNDGINEHIGPRALEVAEGTNGTEYLWVGGEFTRVNGANQQGLTRFGPQDTGNPPVPSLAVRAITPNAIQVNIRGVYDPDDEDITYAVYRGSNTTTPIWTGVAKSHWWYAPQLTFVDTNVTPGTSYTYRVRAIDGAGNQSGLSGAQSVTASATGSAYATAIINDNPRLYYRYDDSGTWVLDSSGETVVGLDGTARNGLTRTAGVVDGNAASFNDANRQYIWNDHIANGPTEYSIETWFRTTSTTGGALVNYGNGRPRTNSGEDVLSSGYTIGNNPLGFRFGTMDRVVYMEANTGRLRFGIRTSSSNEVTLRSPSAYNDGQWHHVVATQGPLGMRLYVDGVLVAQNSETRNYQYYGVWHVGGDNLSGYPNSGNNNGARFFDGLIDETAVYYHVLGAAQVANHYIAGGGTPGGGDTTPPSVPTGLVRTGAPAVNLSWNASTDNVAVAGYRVYRGTTSNVAITPANRVAEVTTTSWTDPAPQSGTRFYRVTAVDVSGNESGGSTAVSVTITDTTPPSVPTGVVADSEGTTVTVSWNASDDNTGVDHYVVYRGTTPDFVADASSQVGTTADTTFEQTDVSPGTWYYRVAAVDGSDNASAASPAAQVVVEQAMQTVTVDVPVVADTMVAQNNANFVYGSTNQLSSRGQSGMNLESYLRFTLPTLPAGATLTEATLRITTSTDPTATSAGAHQIRLLSGSWSEASTTWNNRSVTLGNQIGELANAPAFNTPYTITLDAAQLVAFLGGDLNIAMVSGSTDNLRIYSREGPVSSGWPVLTLTYTVPA